jgi:hypothetical protein
VRVLVASFVLMCLWGCGDSRRGEGPEPRSDRATQASLLPAVDTAGDGEARERVDATAPRAASMLRGRVLVSDDRPLEQAEVALLRETAAWPARRPELLVVERTDEWGRFTLEAPADLAELWLDVRGPGIAAFRERLPAGLVASGRLRRIRVEPGFRLRGSVRAPNGAPVEDCFVFLEPGGQELRPGRVARTDREGRFEFADVEAGIVQLVARHDRWAPAQLANVTVGGVDQEFRLRFREPSMRLSGRVTRSETNRLPLVGATVRAYPVSNAWLSIPLEANTDERGEFVIEGLGPESVELLLTHPDASSATRVVSVRKGVVPRIEVELGGRSVVAGRLIGEPGDDPIELRLTTLRGELHRTRVLPDHRFEFPETVSAGQAVLEVVGGRRAFADGQSRWLRVEVLDEPRTEWQLQVVPPGGLRGTVVDGVTGEPVVGAVLSAAAQMLRFDDPTRVHATTDREGAFSLDGLRPGAVELAVEADGYAEARIRVEAPGPATTRAVETIRLDRPGAIVGRVRNGDVPLEGAIVSVGRGVDAPSVASGPGGRFKLVGLAPGTYRVKARFSTLPIVATPDPVAVRSGIDTEIADLVFESGARVVGRVVDEDGDPVVDALVSVDGAVQPTFSDSAGRFRLTVPGRSRALIVRTQDERVEQIVPIDGREEVGDVVLPLPKRGTLLVSALGLPERVPAFERSGGALVRYRVGSESAVRWVAASGDRLRIEDLPVATRSLSLHCRGHAPIRIDDLDVAPGSIVELREPVVLEPGARLEGVVVGPDGPIAGAVVHPGEELDLYVPRFVPWTRTDASGRFVLQGVSGDAARVVVAATDHATREFDLALPDDLLEPRRFELLPCSRIEIVVRRADTEGTPVDALSVRLRKAGRVVEEKDPDGQGAVVFDARGPGVYTVEVVGLPDAQLDVVVDTTPSTLRHELVLGAGDDRG